MSQEGNASQGLKDPGYSPKRGSDATDNQLKTHRHHPYNDNNDNNNNNNNNRGRDRERGRGRGRGRGGGYRGGRGGRGGGGGHGRGHGHGRGNNRGGRGGRGGGKYHNNNNNNKHKEKHNNNNYNYNNHYNNWHNDNNEYYYNDGNNRYHVTNRFVNRNDRKYRQDNKIAKEKRKFESKWRQYNEKQTLGETIHHFKYKTLENEAIKLIGQSSKQQKKNTNNKNNNNKNENENTNTNTNTSDTKCKDNLKIDKNVSTFVLNKLASFDWKLTLLDCDNEYLELNKKEKIEKFDSDLFTYNTVSQHLVLPSQSIPMYNPPKLPFSMHSDQHYKDQILSYCYPLRMPVLSVAMALNEFKKDINGKYKYCPFHKKFINTNDCNTNDNTNENSENMNVDISKYDFVTLRQSIKRILSWSVQLNSNFQGYLINNKNGNNKKCVIFCEDVPISATINVTNFGYQFECYCTQQGSVASKQNENEIKEDTNMTNDNNNDDNDGNDDDTSNIMKEFETKRKTHDYYHLTELFIGDLRILMAGEVDCEIETKMENDTENESKNDANKMNQNKNENDKTKTQNNDEDMNDTTTTTTTSDTATKDKNKENAAKDENDSEFSSDDNDNDNENENETTKNNNENMNEIEMKNSDIIDGGCVKGRFNGYNCLCNTVNDNKTVVCKPLELKFGTLDAAISVWSQCLFSNIKDVITAKSTFKHRTHMNTAKVNKLQKEDMIEYFNRMNATEQMTAFNIFYKVLKFVQNTILNDINNNNNNNNKEIDNNNEKKKEEENIDSNKETDNNNSRNNDINIEKEKGNETKETQNEKRKENDNNENSETIMKQVSSIYRLTRNGDFDGAYLIRVDNPKRLITKVQWDNLCSNT